MRSTQNGTGTPKFGVPSPTGCLVEGQVPDRVSLPRWKGSSRGLPKEASSREPPLQIIIWQSSRRHLGTLGQFGCVRGLVFRGLHAHNGAGRCTNERCALWRRFQGRRKQWPMGAGTTLLWSSLIQGPLSICDPAMLQSRWAGCNPVALHHSGPHISTRICSKRLGCTRRRQQQNYTTQHTNGKATTDRRKHGAKGSCEPPCGCETAFRIRRNVFQCGADAFPPPRRCPRRWCSPDPRLAASAALAGGGRGAPGPRRRRARGTRPATPRMRDSACCAFFVAVVPLSKSCRSGAAPMSMLCFSQHFSDRR